jgi:transcriptional regulator with XRE-family HTH domain
MFYENYVAICKARGESPSRVAINAGLSKSTVSKWKQDPEARPSGTILKKLSDYLGVPVSQLWGEEEGAVPAYSDEALKFALFGGRDDITPEMYDEVRMFAKFMVERETQKKKRE